MRIIAKSTLIAFWNDNPAYGDSKEPLLAWYRLVKQVDWDTPIKVKQTFGNVSILTGSCLVFNIAGNKYRLVVRINFPYRVVYIRFIGTHEDYDALNVQALCEVK